jgi:NADH dehydrogenase
VLALGDMVRVCDARGEPQVLPGVAPVAMQQGRYAAALVCARLRDGRSRPFRYRDKGNLAHHRPRPRGGGPPRGPPQRLPGVDHVARRHLWYLIGFQNRLLVLIRWAFSFVTRGRGARLISPEAAGPGARRGGGCPGRPGSGS